MEEYSALQLNLVFSAVKAMLEAFPVELVDLWVVLGIKVFSPFDAKVTEETALVVRE